MRKFFEPTRTFQRGRRPTNRVHASILAIVCSCAIVPAVGASTSLGRELAVTAAVGVRCETRNQLRAVSRRNYVVDRVTECRPLRSPQGLHREAHDRSGDAVVRKDVPTRASTSRRIADAARWEAARSRLVNTQHGRSVRAMRSAFSGPRR